jgi:hypothetical protein
MKLRSKYVAVECQLGYGATRYFCMYKILESSEVRLCINKNDAIFYEVSELDKVEKRLIESSNALNIIKYKFVKV